MIKLYFTLKENMSIPVVFIHGNSLSMEIFRFQFDSDLATDFQLIGLDLPGHGDSSRWPTYTLGEMASEVGTSIESQVEVPYFIVAHSLGGHLITQYLSNLKRVKGIILCGTPPLASPADMPLAFNRGNGELLYKPTWTPEEFKTLVNEFSSLHPGIVASALEKSDSNFRKDLVQPAFLNDFKNEWLELEKSGIPVYLTCAKDDMLINKAYIQERVQEYSFTDVTYHELAGGGHLPFLNAPELFNDYLKKTINQFIL